MGRKRKAKKLNKPKKKEKDYENSFPESNDDV